MEKENCDEKCTFKIQEELHEAAIPYHAVIFAIYPGDESAHFAAGKLILKQTLAKRDLI